MSTPNWIHELDQLIRRGQSALARKELEARLKDRRKNPISRADYPAVAALCRRCGIHHQALRLLHPLIRPQARNPVKATDAEKLEYGASLVQIGAEREGLELLDKLDWRQNPQALLFGAFGRFTRWEYADALPLLRKYVKHPQVQDYPLLIGKVNLLAALVAEQQYEEAQPLFESTSKDLKVHGHQLLYGNLLSVWAQKFIYSDEWKDARECLEEAFALSQTVTSIDAIYVRKWLAVLELRKNGVSKKALTALDKVRSEAMTRKNWETVRDCDFHEATLAKKPALLEHLYFGSPYKAYRERVESEGGQDFRSIPNYLWRLPSEGLKPALVIDSLNGQCDATGAKLKAGQVPQRLFALLASDFYRDHRLDALHGRLFPDRFYNPISSPNVVHQAIHRLKDWFEENNLPVTIAESGGNYRLRALSNCAVKVHPLETRSQAPADLRLSDYLPQLRTRFTGSEGFSRREAAETLGIPERTASRYLRHALDTGAVQKVGSGPRTRFRFPVT